jgi:formylglycine-generating enzyme required for sulfatase activity
VDLLGRYAWFVSTSQDHAHPCGSLLPNELGMFDLLGNMDEWLLEVALIYKPDNQGRITEPNNITDASVDDTTPRFLRGGSFYDHPAFVRSAYRYWLAPALRYANSGFRPSRTYY